MKGKEKKENIYKKYETRHAEEPNDQFVLIVVDLL